MTNTLRCGAVLIASLVLNLNARADYITRIWLTHPTSDASTLMINWETDTPGPSRVDYGSTENLDHQSSSEISVTLHHVEVPFPSDGRLHYRVSTASQCSAVHSVKSYSGDQLRIAVAADWQDRPELDGLLSDNPHLLISCGDLSSGLMRLDRPGDIDNTAPFSKVIDTYPTLFASVPVMPVLGNHDRQIYYRLLQPPPEPVYDLKATAYLRFFPLPQPGRTWSLDIVPFDVRILALDLSHTHDAGTTWQSCQAFDTGSAQFTWYRDSLAASQQRFVLTAYNEWHHLVSRLAGGEWMKLIKQGSAAISGFGLFAECADFEGLPCFNTALKTGPIYGSGPRTRFYQKSPSYLLLTIPKAAGPMVAEFKTPDGRLMNRSEWPGRATQTLSAP